MFSLFSRAAQLGFSHLPPRGVTFLGSRAPARSVYVSCTRSVPADEDDAAASQSREASTMGAFERLNQKLRREGLQEMLKKRAVRALPPPPPSGPLPRLTNAGSRHPPAAPH